MCFVATFESIYYIFIKEKRRGERKKKGSVEKRITSPREKRG
jgi:hypothetical protein